MATSAHETTTESADERAHHGDAQAAFIDRIAAKYEAEDAKHTEAEDGMTAEDDDEQAEAQQDGGAGDDTEGTAEHTEADTSTEAPDGDAVDSDDDSTDGDETDHTADETSEESETGDEATDDDAGTDEVDEDQDEESASDATRAALAARGADLTLTDVPAEYRGLVEKKLKGVDAAFTRIAQEAATFRAERAKFVAEERFRAENPHLAIVEAIQAGGDTLFEKVNEELGKLGDETQAAAFKIVVKDKRQAMVQAVESERDKIEQEFHHWQERSAHVESIAKAAATTAGIPWRLAERAIEAALLRKPEPERDLTDDEIRAVIAEEAKEHVHLVRSTQRAASKELVKGRTATRNATPPSTGKRPAASASPRPAARRSAPVDHNNEESRQGRMMETARRVLPGMKDQ